MKALNVCSSGAQSDVWVRITFKFIVQFHRMRSIICYDHLIINPNLFSPVWWERFFFCEGFSYWCLSNFPPLSSLIAVGPSYVWGRWQSFSPPLSFFFLFLSLSLSLWYPLPFGPFPQTPLSDLTVLGPTSVFLFLSPPRFSPIHSLSFPIGSILHRSRNPDCHPTI